MKLVGGRKKTNESVRRPQPEGRAKVFSYYSSPASSEARRSVQPEKRKPKLSWHKLSNWLIALVILISVGYVMSLNTNPRVSILSGQDEAPLLQSTEVYEAAAAEILGSSILNRHKLTINTKYVAEQLQGRFPELANIVITVPVASHRLVFELEPVQPALILASQGGSFVVDDNGLAVVETNQVPTLPKMDLIQVIDEAGLELKAGAGALPEHQVKFILELQRQLNSQNIKMDQLILPTIPNELHLRPEGEKYFVKFDMQSDVRLQVGAYVAVRKHLMASNQTPSEYIDVRVDERAYYK